MVASEEFAEHRERSQRGIAALLAERMCQPILFIGSGLSLRYFGAPSWHEALRFALETTKIVDQDYQYFVQKHGGNPIAIGTEISAVIHEWAWASGKSEFPKSLFKTSADPSIFLKYLISSKLPAMTPSIESLLKSNYEKKNYLILPRLDLTRL